MLNADDCQWSRGTYIPDFMDEFGYPVSFPLAGIYNSSSRHNVERDAFWESARANVLAGAARTTAAPSTPMRSPSKSSGISRPSSRPARG
ncbi:MAG: hypothetical protein FJ290_17985 [Planctomycetes bacterium]|nr:hypothetical protein [Planctomycetota bacterium]